MAGPWPHEPPKGPIRIPSSLLQVTRPRPTKDELMAELQATDWRKYPSLRISDVTFTPSRIEGKDYEVLIRCHCCGQKFCAFTDPWSMTDVLRTFDLEAYKHKTQMVCGDRRAWEDKL